MLLHSHTPPTISFGFSPNPFLSFLGKQIVEHHPSSHVSWTDTQLSCFLQPTCLWAHSGPPFNKLHPQWECSEVCIGWCALDIDFERNTVRGNCYLSLTQDLWTYGPTKKPIASNFAYFQLPKRNINASFITHWCNLFFEITEYIWTEIQTQHLRS